MVLVDDLWGAAILSATSTEKPCSWSCPLLGTRRGGWDVVDCCDTHSCGTVWEEFLTLVVEVGSPLRAALGPTARASLASLGLLQWSGNWIAWFFGSPCEGEPWEGKYKQWDPTSLCSEHLCRKHFGLGLEIHTVELCGSDKWQIDLHEGWTTCDRSVWTPAHAVTILLTGLGLTWIEGRSSHSDTLECAWLLRLSGNDGTRSWSSTGERTSPPSGFPLACSCRLLLLSCP